MLRYKLLDNNYLQLLQDSEEYRLSYLFGIAGSMHLSKLSASIGVSYSTIRKMADYNLVDISISDQSYYNLFDNSYWSYNIVDSFYQINLYLFCNLKINLF